MFRDGFPLLEPALVVPWRTTPTSARTLLPGIRDVTPVYLVARVGSALGAHMLGLHFRAPTGRVSTFEVFVEPAQPVAPGSTAKAYHAMQARLVSLLGEPNQLQADADGLGGYAEWRGPRFRVRHSLFDRFGPEERLTIEPR